MLENMLNDVRYALYAFALWLVMGGIDVLAHLLLVLTDNQITLGFRVYENGEADDDE